VKVIGSVVFEFRRKPFTNWQVRGVGVRPAYITQEAAATAIRQALEHVVMYEALIYKEEA
jgi:hypothetical protein